MLERLDSGDSEKISPARIDCMLSAFMLVMRPMFIRKPVARMDRRRGGLYVRPQLAMISVPLGRG